MNEHSRAALKISLDEKIRRREELRTMAEQYLLRAKVITGQEVEQLSEEIRQIQADLE